MSTIMNETKQITLAKGVKLGDNTVTDITITRPNVGHLKGISLTKLFETQTEELLKLIPRVTSPSLPQPALERMDFAEFLELTGEVLGFLAPTDDDTAIPDASKK